MYLYLRLAGTGDNGRKASAFSAAESAANFLKSFWAIVLKTFPSY